MEKKTKLLVMRFILSVPKSWKFCERSHTWERGYQLGLERFAYRSDEIKLNKENVWSVWKALDVVKS